MLCGSVCDCTCTLTVQVQGRLTGLAGGRGEVAVSLLGSLESDLVRERVGEFFSGLSLFKYEHNCSSSDCMYFSHLTVCISVTSLLLIQSV